MKSSAAIKISQKTNKPTISISAKKAEKLHRQRLEKIRKELNKSGISAKKLEQLGEQQRAFWNPVGMTEKEMEDVLISLFIEIGKQDREIEMLKKQLAEKIETITSLEKRLKKQ